MKRYLACEIAAMDFRDRIKKVLADKDLSVREVSVRAGSDSMLHKILNPEKRGGIRYPSIDKIEAVADALEVSPGWLAFGEGDTLTDELLQAMADEAVSEVRPGMTIGQIRRVVASALHEQLKLHLVVEGVQRTSDGATAPGKGALSPDATSEAEPAGSRNA